MITTETIITFVAEFTGSKKVKPETDILNDLGCGGDDFHELMEKFADTFAVDMSDYLWYFHSEEEGIPFIGAVFFKRPSERVERIPVTPALLTEFANSGKWSIDYPPHHIPKIRWDIRIDIIIFISITLGIVIYQLLK